MKKQKITKAQIKKKELKEARKLDKEKLLQWRNAVKERDKNLCQLCFKEVEGKSAHVHHIVPNLKKFKSLRCDINNGILLCSYHHKFAFDSPHMNAILFTVWLKHNKREQYIYLLKKLSNNLTSCTTP